MDNYYAIGCKIRDSEKRREFFAAVVEYYYEEKEPAIESEVVQIAFAGVKYSLDKAISGKHGGEKSPAGAGKAAGKRPVGKARRADGGKSRGGKAQADGEAARQAASEANATGNAEQPPKQNAKETPSKPPSKEEEEEKEVSIAGAIDEPPYPLACLAALNEAIGAAYGSLPPKAARHLALMEGRYAVDDVAAMVRYKRDEWRGTPFARNLTPNTLFGPEHFEQYMHQAKASEQEREASDAGFAEYA